MPAKDTQKPKKSTPPPKEDNTLAALSHFSILACFIIGPFCIAIPLIIWLLEQNKPKASKKLVFEAKQAFFYQLALFLASIVLGVIAGILTIIVIGLLLIPILGILFLAGVAYGVYGGIKVSQGEEFRYKYVTDFIETKVSPS